MDLPVVDVAAILLQESKTTIVADGLYFFKTRFKDVWAVKLGSRADRFRHHILAFLLAIGQQTDADAPWQGGEGCNLERREFLDAGTTGWPIEHGPDGSHADETVTAGSC